MDLRGHLSLKSLNTSLVPERKRLLRGSEESRLMRTLGVSATRLDQCQGMLVRKLLTEHLLIPHSPESKICQAKLWFPNFSKCHSSPEGMLQHIVWARATVLILHGCHSR